MKEKMGPEKRRKYDAAFKEEVLKMVFNGRPVPEVAQSLGIGENLIYRWKRRDKKAQSHAASNTADSGNVQIESLNKRIHELEMERDILKKALAVFSRGK